MTKTMAFTKTLPPIILLPSTLSFSSGFEEAKTCAMKLAKTDLQFQRFFMTAFIPRIFGISMPSEKHGLLPEL
jgi:hypothetical protein